MDPKHRKAPLPGKKENSILPYFILCCCLLLLVPGLRGDQEKPKKEEQERDLFEASFEELFNIEVETPGRTARTISDSPGIVSVITREDIKRLGIINLADVFAYLPGFTVTDVYWTREIITARELFQAQYNDKILLLIDGVPAYEAVNTEYYLDLLPVEAVERIEVIRGPGSTLYGTNAFAGVINIITRSGGDLEGIDLKTTGGSYSLFEGTVTVGKQLGDVDLFLSGNIRRDKGYSHTIPYTEEGAAGVLQDYPKQFYRTHMRMKWKGLSLTFQAMDYHYDHLGMVPMAWAQGEVEHHTWNLVLGYASPPERRISTRNTFRVMKQIRDNETGPFGLGTRVDGLEATAPTYVVWKSIIYQLESQWNFALSKQFTLIAGVAVERRDPYRITTIYDDRGLQENQRILDRPGSYDFPPEKNILDYGLYAQVEWKTPLCAITGGVRHTYMEIPGTTFTSPRMAIIFNLLRGFNVKILYGKAFRAPSIFETQVFTEGILYGGRGDIKVEEVSALELGLDYTGEHIGVRLNGYYTEIGNLIGRRHLTWWEKDQLDTEEGIIYDNTDNQRAYGVELEFKVSPSRKLDLFFNASCRTTRDRMSEKEVDYVANLLFAGGLTWEIPSLKAEISPNFYYVGKREGTAADGNRYVYDPYFIFNLRVGFRLLRNLDINLIGKNLLNKKYYYPEMTRNRNGVSLPGNVPASVFVQLAYHIRM